MIKISHIPKSVMKKSRFWGAREKRWLERLVLNVKSDFRNEVSKESYLRYHIQSIGFLVDGLWEEGNNWQWEGKEIVKHILEGLIGGFIMNLIIWKERCELIIKFAKKSHNLQKQAICLPAGIAPSMYGSIVEHGDWSSNVSWMEELMYS